jgi:hypothetical protein
MNHKIVSHSVAVLTLQKLSVGQHDAPGIKEFAFHISEL